MLVTKTNEYDKWYDKLKDTDAKKRVNVRIGRIEKQDYFGDYKSVGDGVFELRIDYGPGYRIYYTNDGEQIILLLVGCDKSTQSQDIEKAKSIKKNL